MTVICRASDATASSAPTTTCRGTCPRTSALQAHHDGPPDGDGAQDLRLDRPGAARAGAPSSSPASTTGATPTSRPPTRCARRWRWPGRPTRCSSSAVGRSTPRRCRSRTGCSHRGRPVPRGRRALPRDRPERLAGGRAGGPRRLQLGHLRARLTGAATAPGAAGARWQDAGHGAPARPPDSHPPPLPGPLADASVRVARETDAPAVGLVQAVVWREAYAAVLPEEVLATFEPQAFASVWRQSLASPPQGVYRLLAACAGDQVVGFASIGPSQDPDASPETGELSALGVHPDARRVGHGSRLLNAVVDTLRGAGATRMHTWVLASDEATRGVPARRWARPGRRVPRPGGLPRRRHRPRGAAGRRPRDTPAREDRLAGPPAGPLGGRRDRRLRHQLRRAVGRCRPVDPPDAGAVPAALLRAARSSPSWASWRPGPPGPPLPSPPPACSASATASTASRCRGCSTSAVWRRVAGRPADHRRVDGGRCGAARRGRRTHRLLGHRPRRLRLLEPDDPPGLPARRRARRPAPLRTRRRGRRGVLRAALATAAIGRRLRHRRPGRPRGGARRAPRAGRHTGARRRDHRPPGRGLAPRPPRPTTAAPLGRTEGEGGRTREHLDGRARWPRPWPSPSSCRATSCRPAGSTATARPGSRRPCPIALLAALVGVQTLTARRFDRRSTPGSRRGGRHRGAAPAGAVHRRRGAGAAVAAGLRLLGLP